MDEPKVITDLRLPVGTPLVAGTRLTVEYILHELSTGSNIDKILEDHPYLERSDLEAAIIFRALSR